MDGPMHYQEAENLTERGRGFDPEAAVVEELTALSHGVLALTAAVMRLADTVAAAHDVMPAPHDLGRRWDRAVGAVPPPRPAFTDGDPD